MTIHPKQHFVDGTRQMLALSNDSKEVELCGITITTDPEVFNPDIFFSSQWFAEEITKLVKNEEILIEVGCGTGIVSIKAAKENPSLQVYSTDIIEKAKDLTILNGEKNNVGERVHAYSGDVLDSIPKEVKANSIFWAMPFGYLVPEEELKGKDTQVFDPGYRAIRKFFAEARNFLKENGRLLVGFSVDIGHYDLLEEIVKENGFTLKLLDKTQGVEKDSVSMEIWQVK